MQPPQERKPTEPPDLPRSGEEILREVERLKREPIRMQVLGLELKYVLAIAIVAWLAWLVLW